MIAAVACMLGILAGIRLITIRMKGVKAFGAVIVVRGVLAMIVVVIGPEKVRAWASPQPPGVPGVTPMSGGCEPFQVFAQNRWNPVGARILAAPNMASKQIGSIAPNKTVYVDGWVPGNPAYPHNTPPWDSPEYLHLADGSGRVTFGGVRALPTDFDPTGHSNYGGEPVPLRNECRGLLN